MWIMAVYGVRRPEKAKKTENVIEKYKKKLEDSADLRRTIKTLEDQNSDLLDKNAALEEEYKKVSAFKPLMESYKTQLESLELKTSAVARENDSLRHDVVLLNILLKVLFVHNFTPGPIKDFVEYFIAHQSVSPEHPIVPNNVTLNELVRTYLDRSTVFDLDFRRMSNLVHWFGTEFGLTDRKSVV